MEPQDENDVREVEFYSKAARKDLLQLPKKEVVIAFVTQLEGRLAIGLKPTIPICHLGDGLIEMKINGSPAYRCVYTLKQPGKVVVLHTFAKTCEGPDVKNLNLARKRAKTL